MQSLVVRHKQYRHKDTRLSTCFAIHLPTNKGWTTEWAPGGFLFQGRSSSSPQTPTPRFISTSLRTSESISIFIQSSRLIMNSCVYSFQHHIASDNFILHYFIVHHSTTDQVQIRGCCIN